MVLDLIDVRRAYFYAESKMTVYVELPDEAEEDGTCVRLNKSMH